MIRILNIVLLTVLAGLGAWMVFEDELRGADRKVLFVGNSYVFGGDVPGMVERMAASASPPARYHTRMMAKPDYRLDQHVAEGAVQAELSTGVWDAVVLQEQSSGTFTLPGRAMMTRSVTTLAGAAREAGAEVLLYAHWPPGSVPLAGRDRAVDRIEEVYARRAAEHDGRVIPVGALWRAAWGDGIAGLYAGDGHHASALGAYAAALAVLATLGDVDPMTVGWKPPGVSDDAARRLRALAATRFASR